MRLLVVVLSMGMAVSASVCAQNDVADKFKYRSHTLQSSTLPYRLFIPDSYDPAQNYPLVLALHGAGERGTDNERHIGIHRVATVWADSVNQAVHPCFVVAPQCPPEGRWVDAHWAQGSYNVDQVPISNELATVVDLLDSLIREFSIDTNRLYVTGLSMGGYGTWDLIMRFPHRFAAAVPICGGGDPTRAKAIAHISIWAFHGDADPVVPVSASRQMMAAIEQTGQSVIYTHCHNGDCTGLPDTTLARIIEGGARLLYTEYHNVGHNSWVPAYDSPLLLRWLFAQKRKNAASTGVR